MHLAEYRARYADRKVIRCGSPVLVGGERKWVEFDDVESHESVFPQIGAEFVNGHGNARSGRVASASALLMPQRALVDYATGWLEHNRR